MQRLLLFLDKFFLVTQWAFAGNEFKIFMKAGKVVEPTFEAKLFNAHFVFDQ